MSLYFRFAEEFAELFFLYIQQDSSIANIALHVAINIVGEFQQEYIKIIAT